MLNTTGRFGPSTAMPPMFHSVGKAPSTTYAPCGITTLGVPPGGSVLTLVPSLETSLTVPSTIRFVDGSIEADSRELVA